MNLTDSDKLDINRLLAEALGVEYDEFCSSNAGVLSICKLFQERYGIYGEHHWTRDGEHDIHFYKESGLIVESDWQNSLAAALIDGLVEKRKWDNPRMGKGRTYWDLKPSIKAELERMKND